MWRLLLCVVLCVGLNAETPQMHCTPYGKRVACYASGVSDRKLAPLWTLYTKPKYQAFGENFSFPAPKKWTRFTLIVYNNEDAGGVTACAEVKRIKDLAVLRNQCTEETEPK